jgi:hypothetical protein
MKKNLLKSLLCLFAIAAVAPDYAAYGQENKGLTRSIIINNGDTTVNGKKFKDLNKNEQAKLKEEFKQMAESFKGGTSIRSRGTDVVVRERGDKNVVIDLNGKEPNILYWNDDIEDKVRSYSFDSKIPHELRSFKFNGDSIFINKDFKVFSHGGDSSMTFNFNTDSLLKRFEMYGIDTNLRKRVITMHRDMVPGRPGGTILRGNGAPRVFERGTIEPFGNRNNSSTFNYTHTDKDGVSSRMSIRITDASKEQLKKITGAENITKSLYVSDLTLFPNFSSGKMTLSFNVANKGNAKVSVLDSDLKSVFTDEGANFSGNYVKQFSLPKNGVYYVTVSQSGNWFVKKFIKE